MGSRSARNRLSSTVRLALATHAVQRRFFFGLGLSSTKLMRPAGLRTGRSCALGRPSLGAGGAGAQREGPAMAREGVEVETSLRLGLTRRSSRRRVTSETCSWGVAQGRTNRGPNNRGRGTFVPLGERGFKTRPTGPKRRSSLTSYEHSPRQYGVRRPGRDCSCEATGRWKE